MPAPTSAAAVANAFLDIQETDRSAFSPIDQMKLQKLVYYSHAWWLALRDGPLFDDDVEAWPFGPVIRTIYGDFADFGRKPIIGARAMEVARNGEGPLAFGLRKPPPPSSEVMSFLTNSIWPDLKKYNGIQLSNATHGKGEPWTIMKERHGNLDAKPRIPNDLIEEVFKGKLARGRDTAA